MPQGLQVFNSAGQVTFDSSYGVSRILGSMMISTQTGSVPIPFGGTGATKLAFWASNNFGDTGAADWPQLYISGNSLVWDVRLPAGYFPREVIIGECTR